MFRVSYFNFFILLLLSIPLWAIFNAIFSPLGIAEEETVASGTVILCYAGMYLGYRISHFYFPAQKSIRQEQLKLFLAAIGLSFALLFAAIIVSTHHFATIPAIIVIIATSFLLSGLMTVTSTAFLRSTSDRILDAEKNALSSTTELQHLQSQLSPHFLFNTLNNLYGLALQKDDKLPGLLLRLSELLRYSVYQRTEVFVPLEEEVAYIKNYIEFEKIRLGDRLELRVETVVSSSLKIAPMLLIVFVENAFKHSKNSAAQAVVIALDLQVWGEDILFSIRNTYTKGEKSIAGPSGLGLENVKRRLELLYPGTYDLRISPGETEYKVQLHLKKA